MEITKNAALENLEKPGVCFSDGSYMIRYAGRKGSFVRSLEKEEEIISFAQRVSLENNICDHVKRIHFGTYE